MTTHGALPHANSAGCNYEPVFHPQSPSTLCTASRHGTLTAYNVDRCRCDTARAAHTRDEKQRRLELIHGRTRLVDAVGTHRRLRALMAIGWRARDLAPLIGWGCGELDTLFRRQSVHRRTAENVARAYVDLSDTRGPSEQTRRRAARNGWLPPIWWDDDTIDDADHNPQASLFVANTQLLEIEKKIRYIDSIAVERFVAGDAVALTRAEKSEAYQAFLARGVSHTQAAIRLKLSGSTARKLAEEFLRSHPFSVGVREDRDGIDTRSAAS